MHTKNARQLFKFRTAIALIGVLLCTPSLALAWGAGGHMMVAAIALKRLNPRAKAQAEALLARPINPAEISNQSKDFVNAAHWADDLRPFSEFDPFKQLHFIDAPFSLDNTPLPELPTPNIVTALTENVAILRTSTDDDARAQALRLIIHFVGDIHEPLHCATRVDSTNREGDRGGNLVSISIPGTGGQLRVTNLHSYWDGGIGSFPKTGPNFAPPPLQQIGPATLIAMRGNPSTAPGVNLKDPFNFNAWAAESLLVAKQVAYPGMKTNVTPSPGYNQKALRAVRQRVSWGGYRLAALLNSIWP